MLCSIGVQLLVFVLPAQSAGLPSGHPVAHHTPFPGSTVSTSLQAQAAELKAIEKCLPP